MPTEEQRIRLLAELAKMSGGIEETGLTQQEVSALLKVLDYVHDFRPERSRIGKDAG